MKDKFKVYSFILGHLFLAFFGLKILSISLNKNAIRTVSHSKPPNALLAITQQGWSFFSRNPQEDKIHVYSISKDGIVELDFRNTQLKNGFGIIKGDRLTSHIIEAKFKEVPDSMIYMLNDLPSISQIESLEKDNKLRYINLHNFDRIERGRYLVCYRKQIPWTWHSVIKKKVRMQSTAIIFNNI